MGRVDLTLIFIDQLLIFCALSSDWVSPLDNIRIMVIVWRLRGNISELLCAGLCDTMFTVSSTLIGAVLTGQTDWVCHIGTLTLCIEAVA